MSIRPSGRAPDALRTFSLEVGVNDYAEGSCLITIGKTSVLCTATVEEKVPPFLRGKRKGWLTAEYGMLPRATHSRTGREAARGKQGGRTVEIQRLIGRSLRSVLNMEKLGERQIIIDCDVIHADGGTRTAAITGGYVALYQALQHLVEKGPLARIPLTGAVAAISAGIYRNTPLLDLEYAEDSAAEADANFVLSDRGGVVEIQATAEEKPFSEEQFSSLFTLAK